MLAVIMAGGKGTRLRPITCEKPKPLTLICGRPVITYILDLLKENGIDKAIFTLGYKGSQIEDYFDNDSYNGIKLEFSYEDEPLGTAGCVKKALKDYDKPFIVISGDAVCNFNLSKAVENHNKTCAAVTIITKQTDDPREYGNVITDNGLVTGFSEKPSFLNCICDEANTGVYICSPRILSMIPENSFYDFAKDLFPFIMEHKDNLYAFKEDGYWCDIGDTKAFRMCQHDLLNGKLGRKIANGDEYIKVTDCDISKRSYIGKNVTIGENSIIGENTVLCDNVTIGKNSKIKGSVVLTGAVISDNCTANYATICENARMCRNSQAYESCVIGGGSIIGEGAIIDSNVRIWNNKTIPVNVHITHNIKYGDKPIISVGKSCISGETNIVLTPSAETEIGCSLAEIAKNGILISTDGSDSAKAAEYAIVSGIISGGRDVIIADKMTLPMLINISRHSVADIVVHISSYSRTKIEIRNKYGLNLTREQERSLESCLKCGEYSNELWNKHGKITNYNDGGALYINFLSEFSNFYSQYKITVNCNNPLILCKIKPFIDKISNANGEYMVITIDFDGDKADIFTAVTGKIQNDELLTLYSSFVMRDGFNVALPFSVGKSADYIADIYQKQLLRYCECSYDKTDMAARELAQTQPFLFDGCVLSLVLLYALEKYKLTFDQALKTIPKTVKEKRKVTINCPPQRVLSNLCSHRGYGEGVYLENEKGAVLLCSDKDGKAITLTSEAGNQETANELCTFAENEIKRVSMNKGGSVSIDFSDRM